MYHSIKILYRISGILAAVGLLPWILIADTVFTGHFDPFWKFCGFLAALMVPGGFLFLSIALKKLYKELCSDKLSTISMINDLKKELEETKKD